MSQKNFQQAIYLIKKHPAQVACIFDIDSTLFCMKYRTQAIIEDYIKKDPFVLNQLNKQKDILEKLKSIQVTKTDWSVLDILARYDLDKEEELLRSLQKFWRSYFFKDDYLKHDRPYKRSAEFLNHLASLGGEIFYLTARNHEFMREGTLKSLKKYKFPLASEDQLFLKKSRSEESDADYKQNHLRQLSKRFETLLFFENEPVILNQVNKNLKDIHLFWMNSTHCQMEIPPARALPLSMDYDFKTT